MKQYRVAISRIASLRLVEIYNQIEERTSSKKASEIIDAILDKIDTLESFPNRNSQVFELADVGVFRKVFQWTYTIIYNVDEEEALVSIATIYDGRQSPDKLLEELKV